MTKKQSTQPNDIFQFTKGVQEMVKQFTLPATYLQELKKSLYPAIEANKMIAEQLKGVANFANGFSQMKEALNKLALDYHNFIADALKSVADFSEFAKRLKQFRDEEKTALLETGWIICPSLMEIPYPTLRRAVVKYNGGDNGRTLSFTLKEFYGSKSDWGYLEQTIEGWDKHKLFTKQRMKIIRDSYWAHKNKKYTLSIPTLLPVIEGIANDFCKVKNLNIPESSTTSKAKEAIKLLGSQGEKYTAEILLGFIENQLYVHTSKFKTSKNKKLLNRHGVLHGYYSGYADATRSLKCFMVLDVLSCLTI